MRKGKLTVSEGHGNGGFTATVRLATGEGSARWHGSPTSWWVDFHRKQHREVEFALDAGQLEVLGELADEMLRRGAYQYRQQFAQAGVDFTMCVDGETVEWEFAIDGSLPGEADGPYDVVAGAVRDAIEAQRAGEVARGPVMPSVTSDADLMLLHRETEPWLSATERVARLHCLGDGPWVRAGDGSHIVMLGAESVLKFYVPHWPPVVEDELAVLQLLRYEDFPLEIPEVRGRGTLEGWEYLALTRLEGTALRDVELGDEEAIDVARELGRAIRALHDIRVPKESLLREIVPSWRSFLSDNRRRRGEHELKCGTSQLWVERLVRHLRSWRYRKRPTDKLLHADLTTDHILLRQEAGRWRLSGIIDFGDAKIGDPAYDFAAPFAFWTAGRPELRRVMLEGYGAEEELLDRVFESLLLHEYGALAALELDGLGSVEDIRRHYVACD